MASTWDSFGICYTGGDDGMVYVWYNKKLKQRFYAHKGAVTAI